MPSNEPERDRLSQLAHRAILSCWMQSIYHELVIAREEGRMLDADLLWIARAVSEEYGAIASTEPIKDANEAMRSIERNR